MLRILPALLLASACALPAQDAPLALTNVTLIDGTGAAPRPNVTVLVQNGRISAIVPAGGRLPSNAVIRDLRGKYVIPGLIDAHVHLGTQTRAPGMIELVARSVFMGGVTSIRDMGGRHDIVRRVHRVGANDTIPSPRVAFSAIMSGAGDWITGERGKYFAVDTTLGDGATVRRLQTMSEVRPAVAAAKASGAAGIKIYNSIDPALVQAVADEARRAGLRVWSHLWVDPGKPGNVIAAGAEVVSHADMFVAEVLSDAERRATRDDYRVARHRAYGDPQTLGGPVIRALLDSMRARRTILDATLYVMRPGPDSLGRIEERHGLLFRSAVAFTRMAHRAGVDVGAGTDAIGGSSPNLHVELQLLVDSVGMTPLQAIRAATQVNARALGMEDSLGVIAPGMLADLVVLDADPSVDIANTIAVSAVMKRGRLFTRERPMPVPPGARAPRR